MNIILLFIDAATNKPYEDSLRHCIDSIKVIAAYTQHNTDGFSTTNYITLVICAIGIIGSLLTIAWKGGVLNSNINHIVESSKLINGEIKSIKNEIQSVRNEIQSVRNETQNLLADNKIINVNIYNLTSTFKDMKTQVDKIPNLEIKFELLWENKLSNSKSPRVLNEFGLQVLASSGIAKIVEQKYRLILDKVISKKPENAYQVQEYVKATTADFINLPELKNELEIGAFNAGVDVYAVLFVGALYIRDRILKDLGFLSAIDSQKNR